MARRAASSEPKARVSQRGAKRARSGHPWIFRTDVAEPAAAPGGSIVRVVDATGNFVGHAFWAEHSPIALRLLTRRDEPCDRDFFRRRLEQALAMRRLLWPDADCARVVQGEADLLPGLFVDRYDIALVVQALSEGVERHLPMLVDLLVELLHPRLVVAQNDSSGRDFELLPRSRQVLIGQGEPTRIRFAEGANAFEIDLLEDLKTGAFLDQRENHLRAAEYMPKGGRGLDAFSYHGGFALALATRASQVVAIEQDAVAVQRLRDNVARNQRSIEVVHGNAFDQLKQRERSGEQYDVVVIDPPAFAKRQGELDTALRAYKELNLRGLKLVKPGGALISCSCSGKLTGERFGAVLDAAINDARRPVQIVERRGASRDHPALAGVPETEYLKCWVLRAC